MTAPCKNCSERKLLCHSTCPKYLEFKAEVELEKAWSRQRRCVEDYHFNASCRDNSRFKKSGYVAKFVYK